MKNIKISVLGLGVVGSQLIEYIREHLEKLNNHYDMKLSIEKIYVRDLKKKRSINVSGLYLTDNPYEAIKEADIVIECLGGDGAALTRALILEAIKTQKAVIMSSKKCLALHGKEIIKAVQENQASFYYDATVGGGIPISSILEQMGKCESIYKIYGICNATSNFILSKMAAKGINYEEALEEAKEKGYAENNPKEDVDGYDALYKSVIMAGMGMKNWVSCESVTPHSIRSIKKEDFGKADQENYTIKPVFCIEKSEEDYNIFVGPQYVSKDSLLVTVKENNNVIVVCGSESGERAFYGQGAGAKPTASAMFDDLIKTLEKINRHL